MLIYGPVLSGIGVIYICKGLGLGIGSLLFVTGLILLILSIQSR